MKVNKRMFKSAIMFKIKLTPRLNLSGKKVFLLKVHALVHAFHTCGYAKQEA